MSYEKGSWQSTVMPTIGRTVWDKYRIVVEALGSSQLLDAALVEVSC